MPIVHRQAAVGAVVAAVLLMGANASPAPVRSATVAPPTAAVSTVLRERIAAVAVQVGDTVLDQALDAFGELVGHLRRM